MTKLSHLLTAIFALTAVCKLSAQDWFPEGATWTYVYGTSTGPEQFQATLHVTEQTEADGKTVSKIEMTDDTGSGFLMCQALSLPLYAYTSNDSVYYATAADSTYRLAVLSAAQAGDSWYITGDAGFGVDSNLVEVVSTEQYEVDGGSLNRFTCEVTPSDQGFFETGVNPTVLSERIGSLNGMLFPLGTVAACDVTADIVLMCYSDDTYAFTAPEFESCILHSETHGAPPEATLFPNPASGILFFKAAVPVRHIRIIDGSGRTVKTAEMRGMPEGSIDLTTLAGGLYILILETDGSEIREKILVR